MESEELSLHTPVCFVQHKKTDTEATELQSKEHHIANPQETEIWQQEIQASEKENC